MLNCSKLKYEKVGEEPPSDRHHRAPATCGRLLWLVLLALTVVHTCQFKEDSNYLLVLQESDFPSIFQQFSHIVVMFYAPW